MSQTSQLAVSPAKNRRAIVITAVITLAAFGPYLTGSIRTEQVAIYGYVVVLAAIGWVRYRPNLYGGGVAALWIIMLVISVIGVVAPVANTSPYQFGRPLAGIDNLLGPIAILAITWALTGSTANNETIVRTVCGITVWAMAANTALEIWAVAGGHIDLSSWHGPQTLALTSAERLEVMGRFCGIFSQPTDAGLLFSIAVVAVVHLYRQRPWLLVPVMIILAVGGILTVSKTFLFVGLPVGIYQMIKVRGNRKSRAVAAIVTLLTGGALAQTSILPAWSGEDYLLRLFTMDGSLELFTAGRYGSESSLSGAVDAVMSIAPFGGVGAQGLAVAYDSGPVEALVMAGLVGVVCYVGITLLIVRAAWKSAPEFRRLATGLGLIAAAASAGAPALTANRAGTILWLILGLTALSSRSDRRDGP